MPPYLPPGAQPSYFYQPSEGANPTLPNPYGAGNSNSLDWNSMFPWRDAFAAYMGNFDPVYSGMSPQAYLRSISPTWGWYPGGSAMGNSDTGYFGGTFMPVVQSGPGQGGASPRNWYPAPIAGNPLVGSRGRPSYLSPLPYPSPIYNPAPGPRPPQVPPEERAPFYPLQSQPVPPWVPQQQPYAANPYAVGASRPTGGGGVPSFATINPPANNSNWAIYQPPANTNGGLPPRRTTQPTPPIWQPAYQAPRYRQPWSSLGTARPQQQTPVTGGWANEYINRM